MKLGALIDCLEKCPPTDPVHFDSGTVPLYFASWRGDYAELTLSPSANHPAPTVAELLDQARKADGHTFEGWKGGDFKMDRDTPVWADVEGAYNCNAVMDCLLKPGGGVVLTTRNISDYR